MQAELSGKVGDRTWPQNPRVLCAPGPILMQIFALPAVRVVDSPVQDQLAGAALNPGQWQRGEHGDGVVIELPPAHGVQVQKQTAGVMIPTPPEIARQRPKALLRRSDKAVEGSSFANDRGNLRGGFRQHVNLFVMEDAGDDRLNGQNAMQQSLINQGNAEERPVSVFTRLAKVFEPGMTLHFLHGDGTHRLRYQPDQPFMSGHAQSADALRSKTHSRRQHQVDAVRLQQIDGTNIRPEPACNQSDNVHQSFGRLVAFLREIGNIFARQHMTGFHRVFRLAHPPKSPCRSFFSAAVTVHHRVARAKSCLLRDRKIALLRALPLAPKPAPWNALCGIPTAPIFGFELEPRTRGLVRPKRIDAITKAMKKIHGGTQEVNYNPPRDCGVCLPLSAPA